jgi:hypothetical protein
LCKATDWTTSLERSPGRRLGLSAKRAVNADFVQSALESGEFLIIELRDEQLRDTAHVNRSGVSQAGHAGVGERDHDATPVGAGGASINETLVN